MIETKKRGRGRPPRFVDANGNGQKPARIAFELSPEMAGRVKSRLAERGLSISDVLRDFLAEWLESTDPAKRKHS